MLIIGATPYTYMDWFYILAMDYHCGPWKDLDRDILAILGDHTEALIVTE